MNLQEQIYRIQEMMGVDDPSTHLKKSLQRDFDKIKIEYKKFLDDSKKVIDPYKILDNFENYLISRIPDVLEQLKTGEGGAKFAYDCFVYVKNTISDELNNMSSFKKGTIKLLAGKKEILKQEMLNKDISNYLEIFKNIIDFGFKIGWMEQIKKYENQLWKWEKDNTDWFQKNFKTIKIEIINTILNNLYS